ncbi:hypothetical protein TEA_014151 [Camellia sinensis var. sinensis]|uniref:Cupin type-1 domain-containing protein n=1 Tax=Camellia sinensis var. sinensis TaxID=542762 RepID=A0A4S4DJ15_CAMSN|nr:hypothetical protein TEA_014151 [Camellia sinensis var. sinensis]
MSTHSILVTIAIMALASLVSASDPSPVQDFCVAINNSAVFVTGKACNKPKLATTDDFFFSGLLTPQNTLNPIGSKVTPINILQILGLNTLGISLARIDFAPYGLNPPHTHPRATEISVVLEGTLYVGFVTSNTDNLFVTGKACNEPKLATTNDFFFSGLVTPQNTLNPIGSKVTPINILQILGLNTLGISLARIDFAPYGLNPPHTHPRATEISVVLEGTLYVGFVTSNTDNQSLIHFQFNNGKTNGVALAALSSQNPETITVANAVFGSKPMISDDVLAKAFQVDKKVVDHLQAQFWYPNN